MRSLIFLFIFLFSIESHAFYDQENCVKWARSKLPSSVSLTWIQDKTIPSEGFEILKEGHAFIIRTSSPRGAMYALFSLKEHLKTPGSIPLKQSPEFKFRADNPYIHLKPFGLLDTTMWKLYIDMLAINRFNTLDFHGSYDKDTTQFPNLYPMMVTVPEYPQIGRPHIQKRNLKAFKEIVQHANNRCIDLGLMNYTANMNLPKDKIPDYTAKAVTQLLKDVPGLKLIGFRVGESGRKADFFKQAYIKGIKDSKRDDIRLYTRSWQTQQSELEEIGKEFGKEFLIEVKYNGEHLAAPYHAIHGGGKSYSYQSYVLGKNPYKVIWQVFANGTHRFWSWGQIDFIKRAIQSFHFGKAQGFTLQPHIAFFDVAAASYFESKEHQTKYTYIWQKHWMWYLFWGQLSYNPHLPESFFKEKFIERFGKSGSQIFDALQSSGKILPLITSYRYQGPDHRNFSPETETGQFWITRPGDHYHFNPGRGTPNLLTFAGNKSIDPRSFIGISEYVDHKILNFSDGRIGPFEVASYLEKAIQDSKKAIQDLDTTKDWSLLKTDIQSAIYLGEYYKHRILGLTHLSYALKTHSKPDLQKAKNELKRSRMAWKNLSNIADPIYAPLKNQLRIDCPYPDDTQSHFEWKTQIPRLEKLDATVDSLWQNTLYDFKRGPLKVTAQDLGQTPGLDLESLSHTTKNQQYKITARINSSHGIDKIFLWHKPIPSFKKWISSPMKKVAKGHYQITLPKNHEGLMYKIEVQDKKRQVLLKPNPLQETPYQVIWP